MNYTKRQAPFEQQHGKTDNDILIEASNYLPQGEGWCVGDIYYDEDTDRYFEVTEVFREGPYTAGIIWEIIPLEYTSETGAPTCNLAEMSERDESTPDDRAAKWCDETKSVIWPTVERVEDKNDWVLKVSGFENHLGGEFG